MLAVWVTFGLGWWGLFGLNAMLPALLFIFVPASALVFARVGGWSARALMKRIEATYAPALSPA